MAIPRRIHYFWTGPAMPAAYARGIEAARILNPRHEVVVVDREQAIEAVSRHAPALADAMRSMRIPAAMSDIARIALLYEHGGWYVDTDTVPRVGVDYWADSGHDAYVFWRREAGKFLVQASLLGVAAGHPMLLRALDMMGESLFSPTWRYDVYRATGSVLLAGAFTAFHASPDVRWSRMDYAVIDVITGGLKGSWTYQQQVGVHMSDDSPPLLNPGALPADVRGPAAFEFYRTVFDAFPSTRAHNYAALLRLGGVAFVEDGVAADSLVALAIAYLDPVRDRSLLTALAAALAARGDTEEGRSLVAIAA